MIEKIIYTVPNVGSVTFGGEAPFYCLSFDGSSVGRRTVVQTPIGVDGQETSDATLAPSTIICKLAIVAYNDTRTAYDYQKLRKLQQEITRLMNPMNTGTLIRINKYGTYKIQVSPNETPKFEKDVGASCKFTVNFIADKPIWKSTRPIVFELPSYGTYEFYNKSGTELPFILAGTVSANSFFRITNTTTSQMIGSRITRAFEWGFSVDTETCDVLAQKEDGGEFMQANYIFSFDSDLDMVLVPGMNTIVYEGDGEESESIPLSITTYERFLGVG